MKFTLRGKPTIEEELVEQVSASSEPDAEVMEEREAEVRSEADIVAEPVRKSKKSSKSMKKKSKKSEH